MKLDTFMGYNVPNQEKVQSDFNAAVSLLGKLKGISNVTSKTDFNNFIFNINFDFDSVKNLNDALNAIAKIESVKHPLPYYSIYEYNGQTFKRLKVPNDSMSSQVVKTGNIGLVAGATATSIYRFSKTIHQSNNSKALISKNKTAVMLKQNVTDIIKQPSLFTNTIQLK